MMKNSKQSEILTVSTPYHHHLKRLLKFFLRINNIILGTIVFFFRIIGYLISLAGFFFVVTCSVIAVLSVKIIWDIKKLVTFIKTGRIYRIFVSIIYRISLKIPR